MNQTNKIAVVIAFVIAVVLLLLFGGGTMTGATLSGGMMGNGAMLRWQLNCGGFGLCVMRTRQQENKDRFDVTLLKLTISLALRDRIRS